MPDTPSCTFATSAIVKLLSKLKERVEPARSNTHDGKLKSLFVSWNRTFQQANASMGAEFDNVDKVTSDPSYIFENSRTFKDQAERTKLRIPLLTHLTKLLKALHQDMIPAYWGLFGISSPCDIAEYRDNGDLSTLTFYATKCLKLALVLLLIQRRKLHEFASTISIFNSKFPFEGPQSISCLTWPTMDFPTFCTAVTKYLAENRQESITKRYDKWLKGVTSILGASDVIDAYRKYVLLNSATVPHFLGYNPSQKTIQLSEESKSVEDIEKSLADEFKTYGVDPPESSDDFRQKVSQLKEKIQSLRESKLAHWLDPLGEVWSKSEVNLFNDENALVQGDNEDFRTYWQNTITTVNSDSKDSDPCTSGKGELMPHQKQVAALLAPGSPVTRLLVQHRVGSGKTRTMLAVLDNFRSDPRTKVIVCPSESARQQFYEAFLKFENERRTREGGPLFTDEEKLMIEMECMQRNPENGRLARATKRIKAKFAMPAPVAGGIACKFTVQRTAAHGHSGPLLVITLDAMIQLAEQIGGRAGGRLNGTLSMERGMGSLSNPCSNKIILFDEFHKLFDPKLQTPNWRIFDNDGNFLRNTMEMDLRDHAQRLQDMLASAHGTVLAAFTATPGDDERLWKVLTNGLKSGPSEAFQHIFRSDGLAIEENPFQDRAYDVHVVEVNAQEPNDQTLVSTCEELAYIADPDPEDITDAARRARTRPEYPETVCRIRASQREILSRLKEKLNTYAPKIYHVLNTYVLPLNTKTPEQLAATNGMLILCDRVTGRYLLTYLLQENSVPYIEMADPDQGGCRYFDGRSFRQQQNGKRRSSKLDFTTVKGIWEKSCKAPKGPFQRLRLVVLDTEFQVEGLDILGIDQVLLLSNFRHQSKLEQAVGRADRMCTRKIYRQKSNRLQIVQVLPKEHELARVDALPRP